MQKQAVIKRADGKIAHSQKSSNRIKPDPRMTSGSITAAVKKNNYLLQSLSQKSFIYTNFVFAPIWNPAQQSRHGSASSRNGHRSLELYTQTSGRDKHVACGREQKHNRSFLPSWHNTQIQTETNHNHLKTILVTCSLEKNPFFSYKNTVSKQH